MPPLESRNNARLLGYAVFLGGLLLVFFLAAFLLREAVHTGRTVRVRFPEISTLSEGDPVVQRGVTVGRVRRIGLEDALGKKEAVVELQLFTHAFLGEDTRFVNFSHSLMGARKVRVLPGTSTKPLDESALQAGIFAPGLSEALHKVRALTERVARLRGEADRLLADSGAAFAPVLLQRRTQEALDALDKLTTSLEKGAATLGRGLAGATRAGDHVRAGIRDAEPGLNATRRRIDSLLVSFAGVEAELSAALGATERLAAAANDSTLAGKLLGDRAAYDGLVRLVETLTETAKLLREDGLGDEMKIKPRLGK